MSTAATDEIRAVARACITMTAAGRLDVQQTIDNIVQALRDSAKGQFVILTEALRIRDEAIERAERAEAALQLALTGQPQGVS